MDGRVVLTGPDPHVGTVADHVGLAERADQGDPGLLRCGVPDPHGMGARHHRPEVGAAVGGGAGQRRQAEIGPRHDGAGQPVDLHGLQVHQELLRAARRQGRIGRGGDEADGGPSTDDGQPGGRRNEPPHQRSCGQDGHLTKHLRDTWFLGSAVTGLSRSVTGGARRATLDGVRVLVVEDEARLATALQRGLQAEGFAVDLAFDGPRGLDLARHGEYDAMILDVMLPGLSGYRVVRALRAEGHWLPVLMLSAKDGEHDQADGLDCGADDYLTKPFSYVVLLARLRALLRRGAPERPAVLTVGEVALDPARRRVTVAGSEVPLTTREYGLLQYLMRRAGDVVSKTELLDHVWDASEETAPNAVEVYIGYLRRKLGRDVLETVRGAGYRLVPAAG